MFSRNRSGEELRRADTKATRRASGTLRLRVFTILLFVGSLALTYGRPTHPPVPQALHVKVETYNTTGTHNRRGNVRVEIGPYAGRTGENGVGEILVAPGDHEVKAFDEGCSVSSVNTSWANPRGPQLNLLTFQELGEGRELSIAIYLTCEEKKEEQVKAKEIALTAAAEDCKDFDWEGASIVFSPPGEILPDGTRSLPISGIGKMRYFRLSKYGIAQEKTELAPGTYDVGFNLRGSGNQEETRDPVFDSKIARVEVYRAFPKLELVRTYQADKVGFARVTLDADLWKDTSVPYVKVHVEKLCDLGKYAVIEFVDGDVEVTPEDQKSKPAEAGMALYKNDRLTTGPGGSVQLKTEGGAYIIKIGENSNFNMGAILTGAGRKFIEARIQKGKVQIERVGGPRKKETPGPDVPILPGPDSPEPMPSPETGIVVKTPTATITDTKTKYTVSYDEKTGATTVGVEEGGVEVTPVNSTLQPFTLAANQQVEVTEKSVGAITAYSGSGGGSAARVLLYVGIGVAGLIVVGALLFFFRRQYRLAVRPAAHPAGVNPAGWNTQPVNVASPVAQASSKCLNPQCGKEVPAGKRFCAHCGTRLSV